MQINSQMMRYIRRGLEMSPAQELWSLRSGHALPSQYMDVLTGQKLSWISMEASSSRHDQLLTPLLVPLPSGEVWG